MEFRPSAEHLVFDDSAHDVRDRNMTFLYALRIV
jgi:hypothetical protein